MVGGISEGEITHIRASFCTGPFSRICTTSSSESFMSLEGRCSGCFRFEVDDVVVTAFEGAGLLFILSRFLTYAP